MTLESTQNRNRYIGNGAARTFAFTFRVWKKSEVAVFVGNGTTERDVSSSCEVSITSTGGSVTFRSAPAVGEIIVIRRRMPYIQEDDYENGTRFDAEEVEDRFDQDCAERQDLKLDVDRAVKVPETSDRTPEQWWQEFVAAVGSVEEALRLIEEWLDAIGTDHEGNAALVKSTGTTAWRKLADRFADVCCVKDFGALGDGSYVSSTVADTRPLLFVCAGTSSMQGFAETTASGSISVSSAYYWDYGTDQWKTPVKDPMWSGGRGGMVPAFAQALRTAYPSRTLLFVNCGVGGSTVSRESYLASGGNWSSYGPSRTRLAQMVSQALAAWEGGEVAFAGILWWGGGNDATRMGSGQVTLAQFTADFSACLSSLHAAYGVPVYYIKYGRDPSTLADSDLAAYSAQLQGAQAAVVNGFSWAHSVFDATIYEGSISAWTGYAGTHLGQTANDAIGTAAGQAVASLGLLPSTMTVQTAHGTDDAGAFASFDASSGGVKYIPRGSYRIGDDVYTWDNGRLGNAVDNAVPSYLGENYGRCDGAVLAAGRSADKLTPMIMLSNNVSSDQILTGQQPDRSVGVYAETSLVGKTNAAACSVVGVAENHGTGRSSVAGVCGKAVKGADATEGHAFGVRGAASRASTDVGGVCAVEADISQEAAGSMASESFAGGFTAGVHVNSSSSGSPANVGVAVDAVDKDGRYGFWNGIQIDRSCWNQNGSGAGIAGTIGINCCTWNAARHPYYGIFFGKAEAHIGFQNDDALKIDAGTTRITGMASSAGTETVRLDIGSSGGYCSLSMSTLDDSTDRHGDRTSRAALNWMPQSVYPSLATEDGLIALRLKDLSDDDGGDANVLYVHSDYIYGKSGSNLGRSESRWNTIYATNGTIDTSDETAKQDIEAIPESVFRAWGRVQFQQFRFRDAVAKKGEAARVHVGAIAQRVKEAFEAEGLDPFRYGLLCYDEWDEAWEEIEVVDAEETVDEISGIVTPRQTHVERRKIHDAGSAYGIRYNEALALECAYQRWRLEQIEARLASLEVQ